MMDLWNTLILAVVEGLTEFIPVSSSGHLIIARQLLGAVGDNALALDAVLQLATACALLVYFWREILGLIQTTVLVITKRATEMRDRVLVLAIIAGTVPGVIGGLLLEKTMDTVFRSPILVAYMLIVGSLLFFAAEWVSKKYEKKSMSQLRIVDGLIVGLFQALALVPGMSRSGMTIVGGMFLGYSRADAARFGFILSIPILLGSGLKKLYELDTAGALGQMGGDLLIGCIVAFLTGLVAIAFLMRVVRSVSLSVFALYRILIAALILFFFSA